jgi:thiamine pyrophosphokinase
LKVVIFANGEFSPPDTLSDILDDADLIIAADGGTRHLSKLGHMPDVIVGDLDSLQGEQRDRLQAAGVEMKIFPAEKDKSDLELAIMHAKEVGASQVTMLAALGRRWDHSMANLLMAAQTEFAEMDIVFLHGVERLFFIRKKVDVRAEIGTRLSLIPLGADAIAVRTQGLAYTLDGENLYFGSSRGISNLFTEEKASIELEAGLLLCVISPNDYN